MVHLSPYSIITQQPLNFQGVGGDIDFRFDNIFSSANLPNEPTMAIQILLPIQFAKLLPARHGGAFILPAS